MVAMIVSLCPVLDFADLPAVLVSVDFGQALPVVFIPVQFLHDIDKLPIFAKPVRNGSRCRKDKLYDILQHFPGLLRDVLRVAQVAFDKSLGNVRFAHQQVVPLCPADVSILEHLFDALPVFFAIGLAVFRHDKVQGGRIAFFDIYLSSFERLVCKGIVKAPRLRNDVLDIEILRKELFFRNVGVRIKRLVTVEFQLPVQPIAKQVVSARMFQPKFFNQDFPILLVFRCTVLDGLRHFFAFFRAFLQLSGQFDSHLVRLAVRIDDRIDDIDHLVQNLFDDRIAQRIHGKRGQMFLIHFTFQIFARHGTLGMVVVCRFARFAVLHSLLHKRQNFLDGLGGKIAITLFKEDFRHFGGRISVHFAEFFNLRNQVSVSCGSLVAFKGIQQVPQPEERLAFQIPFGQGRIEREKIRSKSQLFESLPNDTEDILCRHPGKIVFSETVPFDNRPVRFEKLSLRAVAFYLFEVQLVFAELFSKQHLQGFRLG